PALHPEKCDLVGAQPPQAGFDRLYHALTVRASGVRVGRVQAARVLGGENPAFAFRRDQLTDDSFALATPVIVRRVDEVAAGIGESLDDAGRFVLARAPIAPAVPEDHRAKAQLRHPQAG